MGFEEVRGKGEATEDHGPISLRIKVESNVEISRQLTRRNSLWRTLAPFCFFVFSRGTRYPARCRSPYCTAVVVKNTRMQVLQKEL